MKQRKKPGPTKDPDLFLTSLRVGREWLREVDAEIPKRKRSEFMRQVVREHNANHRPVEIKRGLDKEPTQKIEWVAHRGDLDAFRRDYAILPAEVLRVIVIEAVRKKKVNKLS